MKKYCLFFALALGLAGPAMADAPSLVARLEDGSQVPIEGYVAGRPAVMKFWATWCHVCRQEMPELNALYGQHHDRLNFVLVNVGFNETPAKVAAFLKERGYDFPFVFDTNAKLLRAMHVFGTPTHVLLDAEGHVVLRTGELDDTVRAAIDRLAQSADVEGAGQ